MNDQLFQPLQVGDLWLPNRVLMAPLTRSRSSQPGDIPNSLMAKYYAQRATAGLIISEATQVSPQGKGYAFTPGIHSDEQVEGWREVTTAVHARGGRIFLQLWHVGRISHVDLQEDGAAPVAPSALKAATQTYISADSGMVDVSEPRALDTDEMASIVAQFEHAAGRALVAGFDGVEIHGANGYLLDQFTRSGSNQRDDAYGGSLENRLRLPLEIVDAVAAIWGPGRVGYRISPLGTFNDISDEDPTQTFTTLARKLHERKLAYLHVVEAFGGQARDEAMSIALREAFPGIYLGNGGYDADGARERITAGKVDAIAFGEPFIANPDLPERYLRKAALNEPQRDRYYAGDHRGYTDYPALAEAF